MSRSRKTTAAQLESQHILRGLTGRSHALLTGRGAAGIQAILQVMGFRDRPVLIPANTCYMVLWAVLRCGNRPYLVDVDPRTGSLTPETLAACEVDDPAAIIPCHLYGLPTPMPTITAWARERGVFVLEDAALALGATVAGRPAGAWGDASIFSFGLGKIVDVEVGGALLTDDSRLALEVERALAQLPLWREQQAALTEQWNAIYWALHQYETQNPGLAALYPALFDLYGDLTAYRLPNTYWDDLPDRLRAMPAERQRRLELAAHYDERLSDLPVRTLPRPDGSTLWRYPLLVLAQTRDDLLRHLWANGVHEATRWYPSLQPMAAALAPGLRQPPTPNADHFAAQIVNLPLNVDKPTADRIARLVETCLIS